MKTALEYFLGIILLVVGAFLAAQPITTALQKSNACAYHASVIDSIEDSGLDEDVIDQCIKEAKEQGYSLIIEDVSLGKSKSCYKVTLIYTVKMPIIGVKKDGTHIGYAR